jgi:hypothetical protein
VGAGRFPLRAYSELMPSPYVGIKPYAPERDAWLRALSLREMELPVVIEVAARTQGA